MARPYGTHWKRRWKLGPRRRGTIGVLTYNNLFTDLVLETIVRRFPVIAGFRVSWDSRKKPGERVLGVWLQGEGSDSGLGSPADSGHTTPAIVDGEPIKREKEGRKYKIVTREYMAQGHDGFLPLKGQKHLIDDESGQITSTVVRKYLLGTPASYLNLCISQIKVLHF